MAKIIINADDYGLNENITKAIAKCMIDGTITNASLMVNMPYCSQAVELAKKSGFSDQIGLHLNLTEGIPLTQKILAYRDFCNPDGSFNGKGVRSFRRQFLPYVGKKKQAIMEEVSAQFERFLSLGMAPGHFDSHHYVHCNWNLIPIVMPVAGKYGFKTTRRPLTTAPFRYGLSKSVYALQYHRMKKYAFKTTKYFGAFVNVAKVIQSFGEEDSVEMMVHPMYVKDGKQDMDGEMRDSCYCSMQKVVDFVNEMGRSGNFPVSYYAFSKEVDHD